jgi:plastocyanin
MRWRNGLLLLGSFVLLSSAALAGDVMVHVGHDKLDPAEVTIPADTTVVFHNLDQMPGGHSIVADDGSFQSPGLAKNESWSHTFSETGVYPYSIKEHSAARGKIIVE